jgi:O-antigen ligase
VVFCVIQNPLNPPCQRDFVVFSSPDKGRLGGVYAIINIMRKMTLDVFLINTLLFLLPLVYIQGFLSYDSLRYFFFGTIVLILAVFTTYRFIKNKWLLSSLFKSWYFYGFIAYLFSFFIVSITSIDPALSFFSSFQRIDGAFTILFLSLFTLSIYSIIAVEGQKVIKQFLISSILGATILSLFIIFSSEGVSLLNMNWLENSRGGAMTGNSSVAGSYILWNIFFAVILFVKSNSIKKKIFWIFPFMILVLSPLFINLHFLLGKEKYIGLMAFIGSARGALFGIIFGFLIFVGVYFLLQNNRIKKYIGVGLISIIFISTILGGISILQKSSFLHQKFIENVGENRLIFWNSAIKGFKEHPLLGWGPGTFNYPYHKFFNPQVLFPQNGYETTVDKAHNIFFETLVGGGILLILALCFFLSTIIVGLVKLIKNNKLSTIETSLFIGVLSGWLLQAQLVFDSTVSLTMLFLLCGMVYGSLINKPEIKKQKIYYFSKKEKFIFFIAICLIFTLFIYTIALPYKKNRVMYKTYNASLPSRAGLWQNFSGVSPMGDSSDSIIIFYNIFKTYDKEKQNIRTWDIRKKEIVLKELDAIIDYLFILINKKDDYDLILTTARISYLRMYIAEDVSTPLFNKTQNLIQKAILLSPTDPQPYWIKVQLEIVSGNFMEAKNLLEKSLILAPKLTYTHNLILQFAKNINDEVYYNFALKRAQENFIINK